MWIRASTEFAIGQPPLPTMDSTGKLREIILRCGYHLIMTVVALLECLGPAFTVASTLQAQHKQMRHAITTKTRVVQSLASASVCVSIRLGAFGHSLSHVLHH
jgi:hypothetical protein